MQQDKSKIVNINSYNEFPLDYNLAKEIEDRLLLEKLKDVLEKSYRNKKSCYCGLFMMMNYK